MKNRILLLFTLSMFSIFTACDYERPELLPVRNTPVTPEVPETPEPTDTPTAQEFDALHTAALENLKQLFTFDAAAGTVTFTSEKGVSLTLNTGCLSKNGNPVTGSVQLEYVELFNRGNMLTANKPTMGLMPNGDKALLISGGEFYINATQDGTQLTMSCGLQLMVPTNLTGGQDNDMTLWYGLVGEDGNIVWDADAVNENPNQEAGVGAEGENYYCYFNHFGWTNVDKFYSDPRPKTTIYVDVPDGYDNNNSAVYLAYAGEGNALALLDTYDPATGLFSEHYGQIPIGLECYVIFVSEDNGQWTYAIKAVTIAADQIITITDADLASITEAQLIAAIDALP